MGRSIVPYASPSLPGYCLLDDPSPAHPPGRSSALHPPQAKYRSAGTGRSIRQQDSVTWRIDPAVCFAPTTVADGSRMCAHSTRAHDGIAATIIIVAIIVGAQASGSETWSMGRSIVPDASPSPRNAVYGTVLPSSGTLSLDGVSFRRDRAKHPALRYCPLDVRSRRMLRPYGTIAVMDGRRTRDGELVSCSRGTESLPHRKNTDGGAATKSVAGWGFCRVGVRPRSGFAGCGRR